MRVPGQLVPDTRPDQATGAPVPPTLLCVANFAANTGFAWNYIEGVYAVLADHLARHGVRTLVAYPAIDSPPEPLRGSAAIAVERAVSFSGPREVLALARWSRRENVRALYLADRDALELGYLPLRLAGVRRIVVHDHASGEQRAPRGFKWAAKWLAARAPGITSDRVVAVSDYVARRQRRVGLVPRSRIVRVYNSVPVPKPSEHADRQRLRRLLGLVEGRPVVACAGRCTREKGLAQLLRAFDRVAAATPAGGPPPALVYFGDGPFLPELRRLRETLASRESVFLAGYRADAAALLGGADLCVVPSLWAEAFGLAVVEPMARARPVIASRIGGIPELVQDGVTGMLVPPGDEDALARAISAGLSDPQRLRAMGQAARRWVQAELGLERKLAKLLPLLEAAFERRCGL